ncbi:MAG TPA: hypothetical protein PKV98_14975 [Burkholderiaceae bacterium]|nr:hypothetical protein [Burkholderiaceae bacterium]
MAKLSVVTSDGPPRDLRQALRALVEERFDTLEGLVLLAEESHAQGVGPVAMAAAGLVVVGEHLRAAVYEHSARATVLLSIAPLPPAPRLQEEVLACAGAVVCESYGTWPAVDAARMHDGIRQWVTGVRSVLSLGLAADVVLIWVCALGEWCERNGLAAEFESVAAVAERADLDPGASPWMRAHWRVVQAWHLQAFGHTKQADAMLVQAEKLAHDAGLPALEAMVWLQQARLTLWRFDGERARDAAARAASRGDARRSPVWLADQADVECRLALVAGDYTQALAHARRAGALLRLSGAPGSYSVTYQVNEAYALIGVGSHERASELFASLRAAMLPPYLAGRVAVLQSLSELVSDDAFGRWDERSDALLADTMRRLRELEWPNVFTFLPLQIARLFARALDSGVESAWVTNAIRLRDLAPPPLAGLPWPWRVRLRVLGPFECEVDGQRLASQGGKAAARPLALLRRIAVLAGHDGISSDTLARGLWPGEGREGREKVLETTLARLRKLLGCSDAILLHEHRVRLNPNRVWLDAAMFMGELNSLRGTGANEARWRRVFDLYRGPVLADEQDAWIAPWRDRLRALLASALLTAGETAGDRERWLRACAADPSIAMHRPEPRHRV